MPVTAGPDAAAEAKRPPVPPAELRAFKRSMWLVLGLCSMMFAGIFV